MDYLHFRKIDTTDSDRIERIFRGKESDGHKTA